MADQRPQFEIDDSAGSTVSYAGSVGTLAVNIPTAANKEIGHYFVRCKIDQTPITKRLQVSIDGGTTYRLLGIGEWMSGTLRGTPRIKQIQIKGSVSTVDYEAVLDFEP